MCRGTRIANTLVHYSKLLVMKKLLIISFLSLFSYVVIGQTGPSNFTFTTQTATVSSYTADGFGNNYNSGTTYNVFFGQNSSGGSTNDQILTHFDIAGSTYSPITKNNGECYDRVVVNRVVNDEVSDLDKQTLFFEFESRNGSNAYFRPSYTDIQEAVNTRILNRGGDNVFSNRGGSTLNNIERIDLIIDGGVFTPDATKAGFLINERGGNDDFVVAAITGMNNGVVTTLGSIVNVSRSMWGNTGKGIVTTVFQRYGTDTYMRPNQDLSSQNVYGVFISYEDLGIADNQQIYGICIFPGDVNSSMDLIGLTDVPTNTTASSNAAGGLDLMGGGGYFGADDIIVTDLEVEISADNLSPNNGDQINVTLDAHNNGPLNDNNIVVTMTIPTGYSYVSTTSGFQGNVNVVGNTITWTMDELLVYTTEQLVIQLTANTLDERVFTSNITGDKQDINPGNNDDLLVVSEEDNVNFPITWGSFEVQKETKGCLLEWTTLSELNNDFFEIQSSTNGVDFKTIGFVNAEGTTTKTTSYNFFDYQYSGNLTYYRLKQVDVDGTSDYSIVRKIRGEVEDIMVYPNPTQGELNVRNLSLDANVYLFDAQGRVMLHKVATEQTIIIDLNACQKGSYILKVVSNENVQVEKILLR